jgi:signal transduction histidine kinase
MHGDLSARVPFTKGGDEFDELSHNLNQMLDKIEMLLQSLGQFANNIAHDLRSPLNRIIARTEAGLRGLKEQSAARRLLERNVDEMQELVGTFNSILNISELEANTAFRTFVPCDLHMLIERLVDFYEPYAHDKNIALHSELNHPLFIEGEKNLLTQAFANLIDNAIKFTSQGGSVNIRMEANEDGTAIIIEDTGTGIPEHLHKKVFEKFFRAEASRSEKGNGLGLSLVAAIARIHGAQITLTNTLPGLRVSFTFPQIATREYTPTPP